MLRPLLCGMLIAPLLAAAPAARAQDATPLTLPDAVDLALRHSPALAGAEGRESAAWAAVDRSAAENWPQLRVDGRYGHVSEVSTIHLPGAPTISIGEKDVWIGSASLQQLLFAGGRVTALVRQAESGADAAHASRTRARQAVAFGAERAFRLLLATQDESETAAKNLAAADDHLRVAQSRVEARVAARFDVLRAEVGVAEARQDVIRAGSDLQVARAQLLQALGLAEGVYRAVAPPVPAAARQPLDALLRDGRERRPELAALARGVEAAQFGVAAARAERWPTVGLTAGYQYVTPESSQLFSYWSAGAFVSLPVLDGGRIAARRGEAAAALVQAQAALDAQRRQVEAEVRQAYARAESADAERAVAAKRLEQADELLRLAEVRYQGGVGTATEVADAQASLARARSGLTRAQAQQGIAEAELALAAGLTRAEPSSQAPVEAAPAPAPLTGPAGAGR